jgi:hypothetical protein
MQMTDAPTELQDQNLWPDSRIEQAEAELAAEKARRAAAEAADKAASLTLEQKEAASMKAYGALQGVEGRRQVLEKYGFDPGWRD